MILRCLLASLTLMAGIVVRATAAGSSRPNILIAVADDWSFPHASAYGLAWVRTPAFDRVAREGVLFLNAYTPVAKCSASRASLLTGLNPWQLGAGFTHWSFFPPEVPTVTETLGRAGYRVGFTGKGWAPGIARQADGSPRLLLGTPFQTKKAPPPTTGISDHDYAGNFAAFLDAAPAGGSWCFWYGGMEPHRAYEAGSGVTKGGKKPDDIRSFPAHWPDHETVRSDLLDYALEVEHFDTHLGRMLAELERRGQLENTLILVTSDNGMPFPRAKGQCYDISVHLPLAIRWPAGVPHPGRSVDDYVSLPDLVPTLMEAAGLAWPSPTFARSPARSLLPLLRSDREGRVDPTRDAVLIGRERHDPGRPRNQGYPIRGIIADGLLYLRNYHAERWPSGNPETGYRDVDSSPTKSLILARHRTQPDEPAWLASFGMRADEELYDLSTDPDCVENVVGHLDRAAARYSLTDRLNATLSSQGDPRLVGPDPEIFDTYPFANPDHVDFYERFQSGEATLPRSFAPTDIDPLPKN
ncbi:MAG: sulfatase [Opitutaceae bacterium]